VASLELVSVNAWRRIAKLNCHWYLAQSSYFIWQLSPLNSCCCCCCGQSD